MLTLLQDSLSDKKGENETPESSSESIEVRTDQKTKSHTLCPHYFDLLLYFHIQATSPSNEDGNEMADSKETSDSSQSIAVSAGDDNRSPT